MITNICQDLRNWFTADKDKIKGTYKISSNVITPNIGIQSGQYIRIIGSVFNDGVYKYGDDVLVDEEFEGAIWLMKPPKDFLKLVKDIEEYNEKNKDVLNSPYTSESFGGYSYTKASTSDGSGYDWRKQYKSSLNMWRKLL